MLIKWLPAIAVLLAATCACGDDKTQEGAALVARAVEISNIPADHATPFTLTATFRVIGSVPEEVGTYSETWISSDQWRREITLGKFHRLEVANGRKKWLIDQDQNPRYFGETINVLEMSGPEKNIRAKGLDNKQLNGIQANCVHLEELSLTRAYCIDQERGTLLTSESLQRIGITSHILVGYSDYEKFGDHLFPREIAYRDFTGDTLAITVTELSRDVSSDPTLFAPPPGALELGNCSRNGITPPVVTFQPDPLFPGGRNADRATVVLSLIVGTEGKPHSIRVANSGGSAFDDAAIRAVQEWKFKPATCQGQSVAVAIMVEVEFRRP